ncbi:hypothetical protein A33I_18795 [Alkalihalophilus marmarensis DSM 21297]|uniref:Uncharacterized protein n=1 Tax=Alkalihalophilus marmarensis DSM 21297 TaxID=1188261 RepID=U6SML7_9BACI|nr:hypothetical protein A33I_18795 [Alkalihalophilus marmarensis DSM 21297]
MDGFQYLFAFARINTDFAGLYDSLLEIVEELLESAAYLQG